MEGKDEENSIDGIKQATACMIAVMLGNHEGDRERKMLNSQPWVTLRQELGRRRACQGGSSVLSSEFEELAGHPSGGDHFGR